MSFQRPGASQPKRPFNPLGNRADLATLARLLAPFFLPASSSQPPTASSDATGNRVIAITTKTQNKPRLQDAATLNLGAGGQLEWSYDVAFTAPPSVTATPEGPPPSAGAQVYVVPPVGTNAVIVKSTDSSDRRPVHLAASQVSSGD